MTCLLISKSKRKTKRVTRNANLLLAEGKCFSSKKKTDQDSAGASKECIVDIFWFFLTSKCKKIYNKSICWSKISFINPLNAQCFKCFEKMQAILLYCVASQQQTNTFKRQTCGLLFLKNSGDFNEFSPLKSFKATERDQKTTESQGVPKNAYMPFIGS